MLTDAHFHRRAVCYNFIEFEQIYIPPDYHVTSCLAVCYASRDSAGNPYFTDPT